MYRIRIGRIRPGHLVHGSVRHVQDGEKAEQEEVERRVCSGAATTAMDVCLLAASTLLVHSFLVSLWCYGWAF